MGGRGGPRRRAARGGGMRQPLGELRLRGPAAEQRDQVLEDGVDVVGRQEEARLRPERAHHGQRNERRGVLEKGRAGHAPASHQTGHLQRHQSEQRRLLRVGVVLQQRAVRVPERVDGEHADLSRQQVQFEVRRGGLHPRRHPSQRVAE